MAKLRQETIGARRWVMGVNAGCPRWVSASAFSVGDWGLKIEHWALGIEH
ncbi:hypothetical protein [Sodalis praecaptivus]|nr:hypothetical protein [Sodalis praecaptivus]